MPLSLRHPVILLVEDSEDDVFFFRHALKKTGLPCAFVHVGDGGAAIQFLQTAFGATPDAKHPRPDIVFLDLKLPTFSGFEILTWIQQRDLASQMTVTILSGSEHAVDVERANTLGAAAYLVKPITAEQLRTQVTRWAEKSLAAADGRLQATG